MKKKDVRARAKDEVEGVSTVGQCFYKLRVIAARLRTEGHLKSLDHIKKLSVSLRASGLGPDANIADIDLNLYLAIDRALLKHSLTRLVRAKAKATKRIAKMRAEMKAGDWWERQKMKVRRKMDDLKELEYLERFMKNTDEWMDAFQKGKPLPPKLPDRPSKDAEMEKLYKRLAIALYRDEEQRLGRKPVKNVFFDKFGADEIADKVEAMMKGKP